MKMNKLNRVFKLSVLFLLLAIFSFLTVQTEAAITQLPNQNQAPKMITMSLYGDSSQMAFNYNTDWHTDTVLQVVEATSNFQSSTMMEFKGTTTKSLVTNDGFIHRVVASGLKENTKYIYRLGDKELDNWSDVGSFTTANNSNSFSFVHLSDPQGYEEIHYDNYNEVLSNIYHQINPNFLALTGDIVNDSSRGGSPNLTQWHWALTSQKEYLQNMPVMATAGNHDASDYDFYSRFNYNIPSDIDTTYGVYYSFDYNNAHFTVLNTNDSNSEVGSLEGLSNNQIQWLIADLAANQEKTFKIVLMHKGIYDAGGHASDMEGADGDIELIRQQLTPIFTKYGVDLVLQGHDHLYSRSYPVVGFNEDGTTLAEKNNVKVSKVLNDNTYQLYNDPDGVIYLNSGTASGSKYYGVVSYDATIIPIEIADSSSERMFTEIEIIDNELYATVYKLKNKRLYVFDTFGISKAINNGSGSFDDTIKVNQEDDSNNLVYFIVGGILGVTALGLSIYLIIKKKRGNNR